MKKLTNYYLHQNLSLNFLKITTKNKNAFVIDQPEKYRLPILGPQFNYLIAKDDSYFLYPNDANRYKNKLQNSFQHGGISMEELLVPVLTMKGY